MVKTLLVEENERNRNMLSRRLTRKAYQIVAAVDGKEGLSIVRSESPELSFMDMSLHEVDGW